MKCWAAAATKRAKNIDVTETYVNAHVASSILIVHARFLCSYFSTLLYAMLFEN